MIGDPRISFNIQKVDREENHARYILTPRVGYEAIKRNEVAIGSMSLKGKSLVGWFLVTLKYCSLKN